MTIRSKFGEDGPLTIADVMQQILDFFDLLTLAQADRGESVAWQLVDISMASPLSATGEAFSPIPGYPAADVARAAKERVLESLSSIMSGKDLPDWMDEAAQAKAGAIFKRNQNGIGRTDIQFFPDAPLLMIVERTARAAALFMEKARVQSESELPDLSHSEFGAVEGAITEATTYYRRPAFRIRERLEGVSVLCILSEEMAAKIGAEHNWREVWDGRRVIVRGELFYSTSGKVTRINMTEMKSIDETYSEIKRIHDPKLLHGMTPAEYIKELWEGDVD